MVFFPILWQTCGMGCGCDTVFQNFCIVVFFILFTKDMSTRADITNTADSLLNITYLIESVHKLLVSCFYL